MKKHITLLLLLSLSLSFGQVVITPGSGAPPPQLTRTGDTLLLQGSQPIDLSDLGGTPLVQEPASTKTLTKEDAWIVYRNRSTTSEEFTYTIPNQANGGFTEDIGYTFYTKDNGKIFVKGESGSGVEPVEISGAGQYATIIRVGENSWDWSKGVLPWNWNLYNTANALSVENEANSTTGIVDPDGLVVFSTVTAPVTAGTYAVKGVWPLQDKQIRIARPSGLIPGKKYRISLDINHNDTGIGNSMSLSMSDGWQAAVSTNIPVATGYRRYTVEGTLTAISNADSGQLRVYINNFYTAALEVFFDNLTWEEVNP